MSKKRDKYECCCSCCCGNSGGYDSGILGNFFGMDNGILEAIIFWLIACGAGLLNTNSILIILLFLLYGWSGM